MLNRTFAFLARRECQILTALLLLQLAGSSALARKEFLPTPPPLQQFPATLSSWQMVKEYAIEKEVLAVLRADDTLNRLYTSPARNSTANLFVAYFLNQQDGKAPHSPKNCLPGGGWTPLRNTQILVDVPGESAPVPMNQYVVQNGDQISIVLYCYMSHGRVVASEYLAKIYLVLDSIRWNRSDTALVRVVVPATPNSIDEQTRTAIDLFKSAYPDLRKQLQ